MNTKGILNTARFAALLVLGFATVSYSQGESERVQIATGAYITPTAAPGAKYQPLAAPLPDYPNYLVDHAETSVVSPDSRTMLVLTSGHNQNFAANTNNANDHTDLANSGEFIFVFDISQGAAVQKQVLKIPNGYSGIRRTGGQHRGSSMRHLRPDFAARAGSVRIAGDTSTWL